jgi:hypothetical protein
VQGVVDVTPEPPNRDDNDPSGFVVTKSH